MTIQTKYPSKWIHTWLNETSDFYKEVRSGETTFNVDLQPLQGPPLFNGWVDSMNPFHRERVYQYSPYLRQVTVEPILELVKEGWTYESLEEAEEEEGPDGAELPEDVKPVLPKGDKVLQPKGKEKPKEGEEKSLEKDPLVKPKSKPVEEKNWQHREGLLDSLEDCSEIPEWSENLGTEAAEATGLGMAVDTSFLLIMEDALLDDEYVFIPVSRNYLFNGKAIGNENRQIKKINIVFPDLPDLTDEDGKPFTEKTETFLTQYTNGDNDITAVVIQPLKSQQSPFGRPYALREMQTALEKMYLRFYELLYVHKGGVLSEGYVLPNNVSETVVNLTKAEMKRGMLGHGYVITVPKSIKLSDSFSHTATQMQKMDTVFDKISTHINEDSILSKNKVGGETGSGFAGLQPVQASQDDKVVRDKCGLVFEKVIKDINYALYGIDPRSYKVAYTDPQNELMAGYPEDEDKDQDIRDEQGRLGRKIEYGRKGDPKSLAKAAGKGSGEQKRK